MITSEGLRCQGCVAYIMYSRQQNIALWCQHRENNAAGCNAQRYCATVISYITPLQPTNADRTPESYKRMTFKLDHKH